MKRNNLVLASMTFVLPLTKHLLVLATTILITRCCYPIAGKERLKHITLHIIFK